MIRFTVWMSNAERESLHDLATHLGVSQNYLARLAIRKRLGFADPEPPDEPDVMRIKTHNDAHKNA